MGKLIQLQKDGMNLYPKMKISSITVEQSSSFNINSTGYNTIPFDYVATSIGNNLFLKNNGVEIGEGINYISISAAVNINVVGAAGNKWVTVYKNGSVVIPTNNYYVERGTQPVPKYDTEVAEGDFIEVRYNGAAGDVLRNNSYTYLSIFVLG